MSGMVAVVRAVVLAAGISGVLIPSRTVAETRRPIQPGLARVLADGASRAAGVPQAAVCDWARDFVRRHGAAQAVEIARLRHTDAEIEAWRRLCFPGSRSIERRSD